MGIKITPEIEERMAAAEKDCEEWRKRTKRWIKGAHTARTFIRQTLKESTNEGIVKENAPEFFELLGDWIPTLLDGLSSENDPYQPADTRSPAQDLIGVIAIYLLNGVLPPPVIAKHIGEACWAAYGVKPTAEEEFFKTFNKKLLRELKLTSHKMGRRPARYSLDMAYLEVEKFGLLPKRGERWRETLKEDFNLDSDTANTKLKKAAKGIKEYSEFCEEARKTGEHFKTKAKAEIERTKGLIEAGEGIFEPKMSLELKECVEELERLLKMNEIVKGEQQD